MGNKVYQLFEYLYIVMAIFSIYLVITNWETDRNKAYLFILFAFVGVFMFLFKRNFRKKMKERNRDN